MASLFRLFSLFFFVALFNFLFKPNAVLCDGKDENILNAINKYRHSKNLSDLIINTNAACLARKLALRLRDEPCSTADDLNKEFSTETKLLELHSLLPKCHIDYNSSVDGIVLMPACVPTLDPDSVVKNFKSSHDRQYLDDGNFTGAGVGTYDDWVVVVLSTNTSSGNFASGGSSLAIDGGRLGWCGGCFGGVVCFFDGVISESLEDNYWPTHRLVGASTYFDFLLL